MANDRRTSASSAFAFDSAHVTSAVGIPPHDTGTAQPTFQDSSVPGDAIDREREPLQTLHEIRKCQWTNVAPTLVRGRFALLRTEALLHHVADAEAVLHLVAELAGLLGTDDHERVHERDERAVVLGALTRLNVLAGMEVSARLAANALADWPSRALAERTAGGERAAGEGPCASTDRGVSR